MSRIQIQIQEVIDALTAPRGHGDSPIIGLHEDLAEKYAGWVETLARDHSKAIRLLSEYQAVCDCSAVAGMSWHAEVDALRGAVEGSPLAPGDSHEEDQRVPAGSVTLNQILAIIRGVEVSGTDRAFALEEIQRLAARGLTANRLAAGLPPTE